MLESSLPQKASPIHLFTFSLTKMPSNWTWNAEAFGSAIGQSYVETLRHVFWSRRTCSSALFWWLLDACHSNHNRIRFVDAFCTCSAIGRLLQIESNRCHQEWFTEKWQETRNTKKEQFARVPVYVCACCLCFNAQRTTHKRKYLCLLEHRSLWCELASILWILCWQKSWANFLLLSDAYVLASLPYRQQNYPFRP